MLSIGSQRAELERAFASHAEIEIIQTIEEAFSAKAPGRVRFNEMMARIERGDAAGIIAWAPDRLARNSIDGGKIIYLLDLGILRDLKFASYTFENNSQGKFMLQIMFGQSKFFSDALSDNVRRGNRAKIAKGWRPNRAPFGYLNDRAEKTIVPDPARLPFVRRMFELMLSGAYSSREVAEIALREWGLRTSKKVRSGGLPLAPSTVYYILTNPFYAGLILWGGQTHPGSHEAVVTVAQFQEVGRRLRRPGRQKKRHSFAYTGMIRCGSCGAMVTAERKVNRHGSRYLYYHCTRQLADADCHEPSVEVKSLEEQIVGFLQSLIVPPDVEKVVLDQLSQEEAQGLDHEKSIGASLEGSLAAAAAELRELTGLRLRTLITDEEFLAERKRLERERDLLAEGLANAAKSKDRFEPAQAIISFSRQAVDWFLRGDDRVRRLIMETVGSNPTLKGQILSIKAAKPFMLAELFVGCPDLSGELGNVRTLSDMPGTDHKDAISIIHAAIDDPECARVLNNINLLQEQCSTLSQDLQLATPA